METTNLADAQKPAARKPNPALRLALIRQIHVYLGVFVAPSLLFFAVTGALQLFSLHEAHPGYQPAPIVEKLGELHKNQKFALKPKRAPSPAATAATKPAAAEPARKGPAWNVTALKYLFLLVSLSLIASTVLGVWMAVTYNRRKPVIWALLAAGAVIPALLALL